MVHLPVLGSKKLRFECTQCGACCRRPGVVYLGEGEPARLASHLGLSEERFRDLYVTEYETGDEAIDVPDDSAGCPLLIDGHLCSVEPVKPGQCRSYPFWSELVQSGEAWDAEKEACEGIGRGPAWPEDEVRRMLALDPAQKMDPR